ncbi:MAG: hypothetical protein ACFCUQ_11100 [Kiloniellales bacterium]
MTRRLDDVIEKIRKLPEARQDDAADLLSALLAQEAPPRFDLTPQQVEDVKAALRRADVGEFASDKEVEAVFAKYKA